MKAAFHRQHGHAFEPPQHQPATVARRRRLGKIRDGLVIERGRDIHLLDQAAQPCAKNHARMRRLRPGDANRGRRFFNLVV